jgi:hypothetical protein
MKDAQMWYKKMTDIDQKTFRAFNKYGHKAHRLSLGFIFIWYGLLKPFGAKTTTSLLAHTTYFLGVSHLLHKKNLSDHGFLNFANFI